MFFGGIQEMLSWQFGNTSVRSALRIRDGLIALSQSDLQGNLRGKENAKAFRNLLGERGIVSLGIDENYTVGTKWRWAMGKLGFIFPDVSKYTTQNNLGELDRITPAGWNLIRSETVPAMQECYLRAMLVPLEPIPGEESKRFAPLCWTLALLLELEKQTGDPSLSFIEMACFVQISTPSDGLIEVAQKILTHREARDSAKNKKKFDVDVLLQASKNSNKSGTLRDYADMNIRYLKATGMVRAKGRGITIVPEKHALAISLTNSLVSDVPILESYKSLCNGAPLPTDDVVCANQVLEELFSLLKELGINYQSDTNECSSAIEINRERYKLEELISQKREEEYALRQAKEWDEIAKCMEYISGKKVDLEIKIPTNEQPAYLEWCLWRAILAINSLKNRPYEVRRFKVDQDFLPVGTAPGNGPDLIAEFNDYVVVIEVTLSESSRQEAMEGEPVRRHIADILQKYDKPVYGLFIAKKVDSNTIETFRVGTWFLPDDTRLRLNVVPLTLVQFSAFFRSLFDKKTTCPSSSVVNLLKECETSRDLGDALVWKKKLESTIENKIV